MREILFRGKSLNTGEWVSGVLVIDHYDSSDGIKDEYKITDIYYGVDKFGHETYMSGLSEQVDPSTVGQFTGLHDTNGNKIFEGDIVSSEVFSKYCNDGKCAKTIWDEKTAMFNFVTKSVTFDVDDCYEAELEIVGNIYDNPKLMEEDTMADKSNLEKILNLKNDEEFKIKGYNPTYRIHNGIREFKFEEEWRWCNNEEALTAIINDPSRIIRKPRFNDEEMTFLRLLRKYGKVTKIHKGNGRTSCCTSNGRLIISNIGELLKYEEIIDLNEMFREEDDGN